MTIPFIWACIKTIGIALICIWGWFENRSMKNERKQQT